MGNISQDSAAHGELTFERCAAMVAEGVEETPTLEFKRKPSAGIDLQKTDKRLLGEAISGFANATGGTLIIGIDTANSDGIDRASGIQEIDNVQQVANRFAAYAAECVNPPVEGVRVRPVPSENGRGLIEVIVPRGQARPHMCRAPDRHTYFRRVMTSFVPMEAYEVEEMLRLKTSPTLEFIHKFQQMGSVGGNNQFCLFIGLRNTSNVTAKFPYIEYSRDAQGPKLDDFGLHGNGQNLWPTSGGATEGILFAAGADQVIHPEQQLYVAKINMCELDGQTYRQDWGISRLPEGGFLDLVFHFGCEDFPRHQVKLTFSEAELKSIARPTP